MKNTPTHTTLRKIIFIIEFLSSAELLSRTLMELWMNGFEAERISIGQTMSQLSESTAVPDTIFPHHSDTQHLAQTLLIVTDRADLARACLRQGLAVIGYLHEKNKDVSFDGIPYLIEDISGLDARFCELAFCRAHRLPYTVLETERCLVREITTEDVPRLYEIYADPSITRYIEALYADEAAESAYVRGYIDNIYGFYGYGMWIVINKENGQIIGRAGIEPKGDFAELGYIVAKEYQNQGYATEVCRAILLYAADCLRLPEVCARIQKDNAASLKVCEKLHFQPVPHTADSDSDLLLFTFKPK